MRAVSAQAGRTQVAVGSRVCNTRGSRKEVTGKVLEMSSPFLFSGRGLDALPGALSPSLSAETKISRRGGKES